MAIISITGMVLSTSPIKSNSKQHEASATSSSLNVAEASAITKVTAAALLSDVAYPTMESGGSNNTDYANFGIRYNFSTGSPTILSSEKISPTTWRATAACSATRTGEGYHLKMLFTLPSVTASNIQQAILRFNYTTNWSSGNYDIAVCAPRSSDTYQSHYIPPSNYTTKTTTNIASNTGNSKLISIDITDVLKSCKTNGKNWIILARNTNLASSNTRIYVDTNVTPTIEYTLATSACNPPTNIINNGSEYFVPGGSISISWSGASAGTENSIVGYRIYWKKGAEPIVGASDGYYLFDDTSGNGSGSVTFNSNSPGVNGTFPSASDRGSAYYFKMTTRGSQLVNNAYYSSISVNYVAIKINSLPLKPNISVDKTRIKVNNNTTVNFIVAPGNDNDSELTKTVWYSTSPTIENITLVDNDEHSLSPTLNVATNYYFWTYDGYEFSSEYTLLNIRINTPPTISSVTMNAVQTYSPSVTVSGNTRQYVKNINGSVNSANITKDPDATLTYSWKLCICNSSTGTTFNTISDEISNNNSEINNIDVTLYGVTFDNAYKLLLSIIDDVGDSAIAYSNNIYVIPAAPTVIFYNLHANSNISTANTSHFFENVRLVFSLNNTGINNVLLLYTESNSTSWNNKVLTITDSKSDISLNDLNYGTNYNFKVRFTCNNATSDSAIISKLKCNNLTPDTNNIIYVPTDIKPYTHSYFTLNFNNLPMDFGATNDIGNNYDNTYTIKLKYNNLNSVPIQFTTSSQSLSQGIASAQMKLDTISTSAWLSLLVTSGAPNERIDNVTLEIKITNGFGKEFYATKIISLNFIESLVTGLGLAKISILTNSSAADPYKDIPINLSSKYPLFNTLTLKFKLTGLQCYANLNATIQLFDSDTNELLGTKYIDQNYWNAPTGQNHIYELKTGNDYLIEIIYVISNIISDRDVNYFIKVTLQNGQSTSYTSNLNICKYWNFNESNINFKITSITKGTSGEIKWEYNNLGSNNLNSKTAQFYTSSILTNDFDNNYTALGSSFSLANTSGTKTGLNISTITDVIYFGAKLELTLNYVNIDGNKPTGTDSYTIKLTNLSTIYNQVPNIGYGQNFFFINSNTPKMNNNTPVDDLIITIRKTGNRSKIYIGENNAEGIFEITSNGLIIDGGSW